MAQGDRREGPTLASTIGTASLICAATGGTKPVGAALLLGKTPFK